MKVTPIGTGTIGLVTDARLAEMGNDGLCLDIDVAKVELLSDGPADPRSRPRLALASKPSSPSTA